MPTNSEIIRTTEIAVTSLKELVNNLEARAQKQAEQNRLDAVDLRQEILELRREHKELLAMCFEHDKQLEVEKHKLENLMKSHDKWSGRAWGMATTLIGALFALVTALIIALLRK
jgi:hypothetical protein